MDRLCSINSLEFAFCRVAFIVLYLSAFPSGAQAAPIEPPEPEQAVGEKQPEDTAIPTASKFYASEIGSARFERSTLRDQQGYTVESGLLRSDTPDEAGSLVMVRSPDGSVTAIIDEPGKRGLLQVDPQGNSTFTADVPHDSMAPDTVKGEMENSQAPNSPSASTGSEAPKAMQYADVLAAYGNQVYNQVSDPIAFALAQIESVNEALRRTGNNEIALRLAGIMVSHNNHSASRAGLNAWQSYLVPYRRLFSTDLNVVFSGRSGDFLGGYIYGIANKSGYTSVNAALSVSTVFRHEVAHNAGADHCGEGSGYAQGYRTSRPLMDEFTTILCRDEKEVAYSNPNRTNFYGVKMGDVNTGDTARVWRENTNRLVGYNPELPGARLMLVGRRTAALTLRLPQEKMPAGVVSAGGGTGDNPTQLTGELVGTFTPLTMLATAEDTGQTYTVRLRATRALGGCAARPMNYGTACASGTGLHFKIWYEDADNAALPTNKHYTGLLQLKAKDWYSTWETPINISVAVWR